jgi:hypothetical protein
VETSAAHRAPPPPRPPAEAPRPGTKAAQKTRPYGFSGTAGRGEQRVTNGRKERALAADMRGTEGACHSLGGGGGRRGKAGSPPAVFLPGARGRRGPPPAPPWPCNTVSPGWHGTAGTVYGWGGHTHRAGCVVRRGWPYPNPLEARLPARPERNRSSSPNVAVR